MQRTHKGLSIGGRRLLRDLASFHAPRLEITYNYRHDLLSIPEVEALPGAELRRITMEQLPFLHEVWPVPLEKMVARLRRGDHCYSLFLEGRIAHYQWIQVSGWHYILPAGRWMRIQPGELMVYHARVAEWTRGRRINPFVKSSLLRLFREAGYHLAWVYTTRSNISSQKGIERAGWSFAEGYRSLDFGTFRLPLPGSLHYKLPAAPSLNG